MTMTDRTPGIEAPGGTSTGWDSDEEDTRVTGDAVPTELDSDDEQQTTTHNTESTEEDTRVSGGSVPTDLQGPEGRQTTGYESQ